MTRLRILIISSTLPWPGHGGGLLVNNLLRQFNQQHEVTLLAYVKAVEEQYIAEVAALCSCLKTVPMPPPPHEAVTADDGGRQGDTGQKIEPMRKAWRKLPLTVRTAVYDIRHLPGRVQELRRAPWPAEVAARYTTEFASALTQLVKDNEFDVVLAVRPEMVPYHPLFPRSAVKTYESHELRSITYRRYLTSQRNINDALFWFFEWRKMRKVEALATNKFDIVSAVSRVEAQALEKYRGTAQIVVNPIGLELAKWPRTDSEPRWEKVLIYLGRIAYPPNRDAVHYFLAQIYPRIREQVPDVRFMVVGGSPPADILAYDGVDGISVTGFVPDVRTYLLRGSVFVLPMRQGAGIKVKAMEAMAAGIPIVSTPEGAEGLDDIVDGKELLVARNAGEFAAKTVQLLRDEELRRRIAENARQVVWKRYNSVTNAAQFEQLFVDKMRPTKEKSLNE